MSYSKVIISGHIIEVYHYEKTPNLDPSFEPRDEDYPDFLNEWENDDSIDDLISKIKLPEEIKRQSNTRARNMIRRICLSNFDQGSKFVTLTFADNITDLDTAHKEYDKFIKRMRRRYGKFRYITVIEFQRRGAIHYHMMSDLPYIPNNVLADIWKQGFVKITEIDHVDNVGAYMIKYMMKELDDTRLKGRKAYLTSANLDRPVTLKGDQAAEIIKFYNLETKKEVFTNSYESEYLGKIVYKEYNLNRHGAKLPRKKRKPKKKSSLL